MNGSIVEAEPFGAATPGVSPSAAINNNPGWGNEDAFSSAFDKVSAFSSNKLENVSIFNCVSTLVQKQKFDEKLLLYCNRTHFKLLQIKYNKKVVGCLFAAKMRLYTLYGVIRKLSQILF